MKPLLKVLLPLILILLTACSTSAQTTGTAPVQAISTQPTPAASPVAPAGPGKITAIASAISGQDGKMYSVVAFDYDWQPGANGAAIAGTQGIIAGNDFSLSSNLKTVDAQGQTTAEDKTFDPKIYSVVFFISSPGSPPQYFTEIRVSVKGDTTAVAPKWTEWAHP